MVDRRETRQPMRPADDRKNRAGDKDGRPGGEDPLVTLARIVRDRQSAGDHLPMSDSDRSGVANQSKASGVPASPPTELPEDRITELLNEIQSSFSSIPKAGRDAGTPVEPKVVDTPEDEAGPAAGDQPAFGGRDTTGRPSRLDPMQMRRVDPVQQGNVEPGDQSTVEPANSSDSFRDPARSAVSRLMAEQQEETPPFPADNTAGQPTIDEGQAFRERLERAANVGDVAAEKPQATALTPPPALPPEHFSTRDLSPERLAVSLSPRFREPIEPAPARKRPNATPILSAIAAVVAIMLLGGVAFFLLASDRSPQQVAASGAPIAIVSEQPLSRDPGREPTLSSDGAGMGGGPADGRLGAADQSPIAGIPAIPDESPGHIATTNVEVTGSIAAALDETPATIDAPPPPIPIPVARPQIGGPAAGISEATSRTPGAPAIALAAPPSGQEPPVGSGESVTGDNTALSAPSPLPQAPQALLSNINNYFNGFRTMEGEFVQVGPRGEQSEGVFAISKPGKIRFRYKPPTQLDVTSDGRSVAVRDNRAGTQDLYPLSKTPLRYLLSEEIDLTSSSVVDQVREETDLVSVVINEKSSLVKGKLTLIFDRRSYALRQWIVTDAQGLDTSVAIFNTVTDVKPDSGLFKIYVAPRNTDRR